MTYNQKVNASFAALVVLTAICGMVAVSALRTVIENKDEVLQVNARNLTDAANLEGALDRISSTFRGYLISRDRRFIDRRADSLRQIEGLLRNLKRDDGEEQRRMVEEIDRAMAVLLAAQDRLAVGLGSMNPAAVSAAFDGELSPARDEVTRVVKRFTDRQQELLSAGVAASNEQAASAVRLVAVLVLMAVLLAVVVAIQLSRALTREVGTAVQHVRSSSAELQAAANQQATGSKESATAMTEIATTITELLATSRQIAASAQQVAQISHQTAAEAGAGEQTVGTANEAIGEIRQQVDVIVRHMLDLGKKSQQIGGVLDIINELAEQTNILSINASIEAAGAGEAGKRFGVVADEVRKLAERVSGSTREVRVLIEEIRTAVNTTVMATEGGSKSVDAGARNFAAVSGAFRQITRLVATTTEAAREIELSTKQQTTAVEQVNLAVNDAAQATREAAASSTQTLMTATQLAELSRELTRLVASDAKAQTV